MWKGWLQNIIFQNSNVINQFYLADLYSLNPINVIDFTNTIGFATNSFGCSVTIWASVNCVLLDNGTQQCLNVPFLGGDGVTNTCMQVVNPDLMGALGGMYPGYFSTNCTNCTSSLTELTSSKNLNQILDMMGRETTFKPNTPLIYVYDDGSTEKVFSVEY